METHQKKLEPDYHRLKTMVKRSIEQEIRNKNFGARSGNFEKNAGVKNQGTKQRVQRILGDCWPRGKIPSGRMTRWPCKGYLKGSCNNSFFEKWISPECLFYKTKSGCRFGEQCLLAHRQADEQPTKSEKNDGKSAVAMLKNGNWQEKNLSPMNVTIDRGNLGRGVIKSWDKIHPEVSFLMRDNWVAYFRT